MKKYSIIVIFAILAISCMVFASCAHNHTFGDWKTDNQNHWHECTECGEKTDIQAHQWKENVADNVKTLTCEVCGKVVEEQLPPQDDPNPPQPPVEEPKFTVNFVTDANATVTVFHTQNTAGESEVANIAYARNDAGEIVTDGSGQVNFKLAIAEGFVVSKITVENTDTTAEVLGYKNLKTSCETGEEHLYRITKITGDLTVTVATQSVASVEACKVTFAADSHCSVVVSYETLASGVCYSRDGDTGELLATGGQVNFAITPENGYVVESVNITNADGTETPYYKNIKTSQTDVDFAANQYRITKVTGDIVVTVVTKLAPYEASFAVVDAEGNAISGATILVYATQDYTTGTDISTPGFVAYVRNSDTGEIDTTGEGQLNFSVVLPDGWIVSEVTVQGGYKNIKDVGNNIYRITKIGSNVVVTIVVAPAASV